MPLALLIDHLTAKRVARKPAFWQRQRQIFTVSGERDGIKFTVASNVRCLRDPRTPENIHLVALVALTDIFRRPSASGR